MLDIKLRSSNEYKKLICTRGWLLLSVTMKMIKAIRLRFVWNSLNLEAFDSVRIRRRQNGLQTTATSRRIPNAPIFEAQQLKNKFCWIHFEIHINVFPHHFSPLTSHSGPGPSRNSLPARGVLQILHLKQAAWNLRPIAIQTLSVIGLKQAEQEGGRPHTSEDA